MKKNKGYKKKKNGVMVNDLNLIDRLAQKTKSKKKKTDNNIFGNLNLGL